MSAQTLVCQLATKKLKQALACGTTRSWTTRIHSWVFVGPLGPCRRLTARRRSSEGPLGLSFQLSEHTRRDPATDDRHRQAQTLARWSTRTCGRCFRWFSPFFTFTKLPTEPRLLDLFSSATSWVIRLFRRGASPDLSGLPAHLLRLDALPVRANPRPLGLWLLGLSMSCVRLFQRPR